MRGGLLSPGASSVLAKYKIPFRRQKVFFTPTFKVGVKNVLSRKKPKVYFTNTDTTNRFWVHRRVPVIQFAMFFTIFVFARIRLWQTII